VKPVIPYFTPTKFYASQESSLEQPTDLVFFNGIGGFTADGSAYHILTSAEKPTPAPWCNVIANPLFGTVISESGQSYSWMENAHEYRLTPWNIDSIWISGEAFYGDEAAGNTVTGAFANTRKSGYRVSGFGYRISFAEDGFFFHDVFVDLEDQLNILLKSRIQDEIIGVVMWGAGRSQAKNSHADYYGDQSGNRCIICGKCVQ
jgi:cellobiose phosphorylase